MTVLVLGATGFIGPAVVRNLEASGIEVAAASRGGGGPHGVGLDRRDVEGVRVLVRDRRVTTVIDLLAYVAADTLPLLAALDGEVERWVMASSCDVYRNYDGLHRKARPRPLLGPLAETSPLRARPYPYRQRPRRLAGDPDAWMDDYDKIPLEQAVRARPGLSGVILRLPMVFGAGDRQRRFRWIISPMLAGKARLVVDPDWARWRTTYGYVDDVGDALATAALHPAAPGRTFNVGEANPPDHRGWISRFATALGWRGDVDLVAAREGSPIAALDLRYPLAAATEAFRQACDWREPTPLDEALSPTVADEARRGGRSSGDPTLAAGLIRPFDPGSPLDRRMRPSRSWPLWVESGHRPILDLAPSDLAGIRVVEHGVPPAAGVAQLEERELEPCGAVVGFVDGGHPAGSVDLHALAQYGVSRAKTADIAVDDIERHRPSISADRRLAAPPGENRAYWTRKMGR